jgi:Tol biopolymer transport system component
LWLLDLSSHHWVRVQQTGNATGRISQACWAKDGQHLAIMRYLEDNKISYLYIALDGSSSEELRPPQPALSGTFACAFSPDGRRIVYAHLAGAFNQLFVFDMDSRMERQLTTSPSHKYQGAWSPDGRWVAFSANTGGTVQVWRILVAGGEEQQLTNGLERNIHLFYSPDGRWLYVQPGHRNIWRMPADGGTLQNVTRFPESGLFIEEPTISPDGRWLVYNKGGGGASLWMLTIGREAS